MAIKCPNKNSKEFKDLVDRFGMNMAESLSIRNDGEPPSMNEATMMLRGSKVGQFKKAVNYIQTTTSNSANDLVNNLFRIVQKVGNELYVVKGSRLNEIPKPGVESEIHTPNRKFLDAINTNFGKLFNVEKVSVNAEADALAKSIIEDLKSGEFDNLYGLTYKRYSEDPTMHDTLLKEIVEQSTGGDQTRNELEEAIGPEIVNKAIQYDKMNKRQALAEDGKRLFSEPNPGTALLAKDFKVEHGIQTSEGSEIYKLDIKHSKEIADAFETMKHDPNDPIVKQAYQEMADQTIQQYKEIADAGYKIEIFSGSGEPYKNSSEMIKDVRENQHLYVLPTEKEFGSEPITDQQRSENPLLKSSGIKDINGKPLLVNDVFRFVHDFFGHTERGNGFGPVGEENAWDVHARMYTDLARRAMTTETRGQNSWVNFGPHMRTDIPIDESKISSKKVKGGDGQTDITYDGKKIGTIYKDSSTGYWRDFDNMTSPGDLSDILSTESKKDAIDTLLHRNKVGYGKGDLIKKGESGYKSVTERPFAEQKIGLLPEEFSKLPEDTGIERPGGITPIGDTYRVSVNQDTLDKIAADNVKSQEKNDPIEQEKALETNKKILDDTAPRYSKDYGQAQTRSVNKTVLKYLGRKFNIPFEVINDPTADWRGKFENGKVFINEAKVNEYTALHEYLHPFTMAMEKDNPELYNNLIEDLQSTEEGKKTLDDIKKAYPELGAKDQIDEALVTHLSKLVNQDQLKSKPWYQRLIDWFKETFGKNGISISDLDMNMTLNDIADRIVDPAYGANLKKYYEFNDAATKYQKVDDKTEKFQQILDKVKNKLTLDVNITPKNKEEEQRKFFSAKQLADLQQNKNVYEALNDYVVSAIINAKKVNEKFDQFRDFYQSKEGKLNRDEILNGMGILSDMEQQVALYNESRFVIDAIREENNDEYEDNFKILANRLNGDTKIINDYHQYGLKLMADWLYPHTKKATEAALKSGNKEKMPGYEEYQKVKQDNPNMTDDDAMERGTKKWLMNQMEHATTDIGFFNSYMSGVLNSKDPISQLVALSLKDEFARSNTKLMKVKDGITNVLKKAQGTKLFTTNAQHKEFYDKYVRQVQNYEKTGVDENGNPIMGYVNRTAFHQPFKYDDFYKAKREMFKAIGQRPNKNDETAYADWNAKKEAWFNKHTKRTYNANGEVLTTVPGDNYKNADFDKVANDPVFKEIYKHYQDANDKLGRYQLKYGIVPQQSSGAGLFSDLKLSKGIKGNVEEVKKHIKEGIGAKLNSYYAQDIDGKEFKNIPVRWTRLVDESDLSYNLGKSVADFWESSSKYGTSKAVEPMVLTLRSFIEGNSFLKINERDAPEIDAKGVKKMGNFVKNITKTKDQANLNRQLVDFLNDTIYGESEKKANIKSPFLNLKYMVYKKGDTSANGKPHREYIYSLEDLKKKTGNELIDYDHFNKGTEKDVNGYGVTLLRNDKILSVNKLSRGLNGVSAVVNLGGNVIAGTSHLLRGVASNFIEATGGKYFNNKEWASAYKEYFKNLTDFSFMEDTRGGKGSKASQLLTHYGTMQGEFLNEYGKHIGQGVVNKLFRRSALFFSIHGAEHMVQTTQMIAAMKHVKVMDTIAGKEVSLYDAYEKGGDGYIKVRDGVKWDEQKDNDFRGLVQSINKDRGNYSEFDKAGISRLWWGKMLIMFRRHIFNGIKSRWGSEYVDYERGGATQGYYRSFITTLASEFNELRLNGKFRKMTDTEAYNFKKTLADVGMFALLATVLVPAFKDEKEHKTGMSDYLALFSRRLQQDVSFFLNPLEWKKVIQSPIVTGSTVDKFYDFFAQVATSPSEEYQKDGSGYQAGDNKAMANLKKLLPVYRVAVNLQDPQDMLKFYDLSKPVTPGK
jgi:hypothetical protein